MKKYEYIVLVKIFFFNSPTKEWIQETKPPIKGFTHHENLDAMRVEDLVRSICYCLKCDINNTNLIESRSKTFYWSQSEAFNKLNGLEDLKQGEFKGGKIYYDLDSILSILGLNGFQLVSVLEPINIYHKEEAEAEFILDKKYQGIEFDDKRYDFDHRNIMVFMREIDS